MKSRRCLPQACERMACRRRPFAAIALQDDAIGEALEGAAAGDLVTIVCLESGIRLEKVWRRIGCAS
jgi:hypothetical protein